MAFKQCASCKGFYNASKGGCINPSCPLCDKAAVARLMTAPQLPKSKPKVEPKPKTAPPKPLQPHPAVPPTPLKEEPSWAKKTPKPTASIGSPPKESGPPTVVKLDDEVMIEQEQTSAEAGYHLIYRGDTRTPAQLSTYGGFTAWVPLSLAQARDVIRRAQGQNFELKLPKEAERLEAAFNRNQNLNLMTLGRQIKLEKAGDTFHISTDPTEGCGGYASGYIYAMKFKTLYLVDKAGKVTTGALRDVGGINPKLVLDKPKIAEAEVIALAIPGQAGAEVAFLTSIPMANIFKYRMPKSSTWYKISV